mgnify:CR=1 FL=1
MFVPSNWRVQVTGVPVFGGWSNKTNKVEVDDNNPVLKINCLVLFGGMEVKN